MKQIVFVALCFTAVFATADKYTTKYDNVNLDDILQNKRLLKGYTNCLMDKGPCSPDGTELKTDLPEALHNNCEKCSEKQKTGAKKIINHLINKEPQIWAELEKKYDPKGTYQIKYKAEAEAEGIKL